jgi:hypothetical protein
MSGDNQYEVEDAAQEKKDNVGKSNAKNEQHHLLYEYRIEEIPDNYTKAKKKTLMKAAFNACGLLHRSKEWRVTDYKNKIISWWDLCGFHELEEPAIAEKMMWSQRSK